MRPRSSSRGHNTSVSVTVTVQLQLRFTSTGLDNLPSWFLRVAAPLFCAPLTCLFNLSLGISVVLSQCKQAWIRPGKSLRPVSQLSTVQSKRCVHEKALYKSKFTLPYLTSVLTRMIASWRKLVRQYIYPALLGPPATLCFADQFVYRSTGSRTAVIITWGRGKCDPTYCYLPPVYQSICCCHLAPTVDLLIVQNVLYFSL